MHIHRSSNHFRGIPVRPNDGAGIYLLVVTLLQSDARDPNSNWVTSNITPKNLTISPAIVLFFLAIASLLFVNCRISCSCSGGNNIKKYSRREYEFWWSPPHPSMCPILVLMAQLREWYTANEIYSE